MGDWGEAGGRAAATASEGGREQVITGGDPQLTRLTYFTQG